MQCSTEMGKRQQQLYRVTATGKVSQKYNEKRYYVSGFLQYVLSLADMKPKGKVDTLRGGTRLLKEVIILFKSKPVGEGEIK